MEDKTNILKIKMTQEEFNKRMGVQSQPSLVNESHKLRMSKEQFEEWKNTPEYQNMKKEYYEALKNPSKKKSKGFAWPWNKKNAFKKAEKKGNEIAVFVYNLKRQLEGPIIARIYGGNFFVIREHVYRFDPADVFTMGKYKVISIREGWRDAVSVKDYAKDALEDRLSNNPGNKINTDDPVLIKAVIMARLAEQQKLSNNKWIWIVLGIVGVVIGFLYFTGKK